MAHYSPRPIDTTSVELPHELRELVERLAENSHDHWARQRMAEGWVYGPQRNDQRKEHPCLVPYSDLPESEKEYDRTSAIETIRAVIAMGYSVHANHDS